MEEVPSIATDNIFKTLHSISTVMERPSFAQTAKETNDDAIVLPVFQLDTLNCNSGKYIIQ